MQTTTHRGECTVLDGEVPEMWETLDDSVDNGGKLGAVEGEFAEVGEGDDLASHGVIEGF